MVNIPIDIIVDGRYYATYNYKHCPAFTIRMEDIETQLLQRYPSLEYKAKRGMEIVLEMKN